MYILSPTKQSSTVNHLHLPIFYPLSYTPFLFHGYASIFLMNSFWYCFSCRSVGTKLSPFLIVGSVFDFNFESHFLSDIEFWVAGFLLSALFKGVFPLSSGFYHNASCQSYCWFICTGKCKNSRDLLSCIIAVF